MWKQARIWAMAAALAGTPFVTTATCNSGRGTVVDFYRDDDSHGHDVWDVFFEADHYHDDDYFEIWEEECYVCF